MSTLCPHCHKLQFPSYHVDEKEHELDHDYFSGITIRCSLCDEMLEDLDFADYMGDENQELLAKIAIACKEHAAIQLLSKKSK